jgi:hypothetical protein
VILQVPHAPNQADVIRQLTTRTPDTAAAMAAARAQGSRVEVTGLGTPSRVVFANPDGTLTAELSTAPTRVRRGNGWGSIDATLARRPDGRVAPKAVPHLMSFSGGGRTGPMVTMGSSGQSFSLDWHRSLPEPVLEGASARYRDIMLGVDLVLFAEANGYRQHLEVKSRAAARNPDLRRIGLQLVSNGVRLEADRAGTIHARNKAGAELFTAAPSLMWDASGDGGHAGRTAPVAVSVTKDRLVLMPDTRFLADPDLVFPVTIDPSFRTFDKNAWATVVSGKPTTSFWWTSGDGKFAQVGQCHVGPPNYCNGIGEARSYFQYDTAFLSGKDVITATFDTTVVYSPNCAVRDHQLRRSGQIGPGTTWLNKPEGALIGTRAAPVSNPSYGCPGWQGVGYDVRGQLNVEGLTTYYLAATNGSDQLAWRKYDPSATVLRITYNRKPNPPSDLRTDPGLPAPCRWCDGNAYVGDDTIRLQARLSDPDEDLVEPQWRVHTNGTPVTHGWGLGFQASGAFHDWSVNLADRHGQTIAWDVRAGDGHDAGEIRSGPGPFVVDRRPPTAAPTVSSRLYPENDNRWHGGVDVADTFVFSSNGVADIDHYVYGWQDPPTTKVNANSLGGEAFAVIAPPGDGPRTLYVQSVDRAGHRSPMREYRFYVRAGNGALARWSLEGNARDDAFLGDRHGTASGGVLYSTQGAVGTAAQFDGMSGHISAPHVLRSDTSLSVAAWVRLADGSKPRAIVSQDGEDFSGFGLWYRPENGGRWVFGMPNFGSGANRPDIELEAAVSAAPAELGRWTHVAGVYDQWTKRLRIYVNGEHSGSVERMAAPWNATGQARIGSARWNAQLVDHWAGSLDEVQIYDRLLTDEQIRAAVTSSSVVSAHWRLDDKEGLTARNAVVGGDAGVLLGGAKFTEHGIVGGAAEFDGVDDEITTGRPAVRTDQSFSVAAYVRARAFPANGASMTAVSQDGGRNSGFYLQYNGPRRAWSFLRFSADSDTAQAAAVTAPVATFAPVAGGKVHLVGVYDAAAAQLRLYVDGVLAATSSWSPAWQPVHSGPLVIGRALYRGGAVDQWAGLVDEVRVYNRAVSAEEARGMVSRDAVTEGRWLLDGNADDSSTSQRHGEVKGGVAWSAGQTTFPNSRDLAARFNGTDGHISTKHVLRTDRSFSVTAWARMDRSGGHSAVVSQDGERVSGFILKALPDSRWRFLVPRADESPDPVSDTVTSGAGTAQVGVWTHLAAVYSQDRQRIELYVNGILAGSAAHGTGFDAAHELQIGRAKWNGNHADFFPGAIDDVAAYSRALFADEIRGMADRDLRLTHHWGLDNASGNITPDAVGARAGTLSGGPAFMLGRLGNALRFDGVDDAATTNGVDVDTSSSFSVSAWVNLEVGCEPV